MVADALLADKDDAVQASGGLEVEGLRKELGGRVIIDDLYLKVRPGEFISLLGPSGCGKTTTLRMIAGFLAPDSGSIRIDGTDMTRVGAESRPTTMVFQNYALWPHMSVFKNLAYPLKLKKVGRDEITARVTEALDMVNLGHRVNARPGQLSGGEQQRAALARAIVQRPRLLLLDEPLSNLDAKLRVRVREDIRAIQQDLSITTVLVTHDQEEAMSVSDRIAVMNQGRIDQFSTPDELYNDPHTAFVASFLGSMVRVDGVLRGGRFVPSRYSSGVRPEAVVFTQKKEREAQPCVVKRVIPRGAYHELIVERDDGTFHCLWQGGVVRVGDRGWAEVRAAFVFDGDTLLRGDDWLKDL